MTTTFYDYLLTAKNYDNNDANNWSYHYNAKWNGIKFQIADNGLWTNLTHFKNSIDEACHTGTKSGRQFVNSPNIAELRHHYPNKFQDKGKDVWMHISLLSDVLPLMFKRTTSYTAWKLGEKDWQGHLFEFIYIRCDPKFKLIDWIIKGGREMNPAGREANYWQHAVKDGCGEIYCLFVVKFGSPAEKKLKEIFAKHFLKAPAKVDGKKTGTEYYTVSEVETEEQFVEKIMKVGGEFAQKMSEAKEMIDEWYSLPDSEPAEDFIRMHMPWVKLPKHKLGKK